MPKKTDPRFQKINELFINYSQGNFDYQVELSPQLDEIDAFISNINMLGEELKATTISKNYFNNIFNAVSDIIFIMEKNGKMHDINEAGYQLLGYCPKGSEEINMFNLFQNKNDLAQFQKRLEKFDSVVNMRTKLNDKNGKAIECMISANKMEDKGVGVTGYQGIIKDMTQEKEIENLVIRTIVDTQEKERERFARDLHDSIGQQLSGIKFFLATLKKMGSISGKKHDELLSESEEAINRAVVDLRSVCFNLMPRALESFGLTHAVPELCKKIEAQGSLLFNISISKKFPALNKSLEIAIFRIVQEFINNSIKHGKATKVGIKMKNSPQTIYVTLQDNGVGFNKNALDKFEGMGLKNVRSRVGSYNGEVVINSAVSKGTSYRLTIPLETKAG